MNSSANAIAVEPGTGPVTPPENRVPPDVGPRPDPPAPAVPPGAGPVPVAPGEVDENALAERHQPVPRVWEFFFGAVLLLAWLAFFGAGSFVPTVDYRKELATRFREMTTGQVLAGAGVAVACYTVTNILFLALIASWLGCMTCRWRVTGRVEGLMRFYAALHPRRIYLAAALRGFFLYLMVVSGFLILSTEEGMAQTSFGQYIRVAGIISVFAFMAGYDPEIAYRLMGRVNDLANRPLRPPAGGGGGPQG